MALTTAQKETIIMKTASALFNKAFSQETSANFVTFYDNNENDLGKLSDAFIGSSVYEAQYANATTKADFGTILMAKYNMTYGGSSDADMKMTAFVDYSFAHAADSNSLRTIQAVDKFIVATLIPSMTVDNVFEKMHSAISNKAEVAIAFKNDASSVGQELSLVTITDDHITVDTAKVSINPTAATTGILLDGYISGGTVFADANGDGIWNAGEAKATTDANGNFTLIGAKGTIVGSGGTDISTGLAFTGTFSAPSGSTTISPLTTLINEVMKSSGTTASAAAATVANALGLSSTTNLMTFDPITAASSSTLSAAEKAAAINIQSAAVQVNNMIAQSAAMLNGAGAGSIASGSTAASKALADMIVSSAATATKTLDLSSAATIESFLNASATKAGATVEQVAKVSAVASSVATSTANINTAMQTAVTGAAVGTSATDIFASLAKTQVAANDIAALTTTAASSGSTTALVAGSSTAAINSAAAAAVITPVVTPPASGGGSSTPATTFTATEDDSTHVVTFGGTATGDISVAWAGTVGDSLATFTRGGKTATADITTTDKITLVSGQTLADTAADLAGLTIDGTGTVNVTALEDTLDADLSGIAATTVTAAMTGLVGEGSVPQFTGNLGNAALTLTGFADFLNSSPTIGVDASFVVNASSYIMLSAANASAKTITGSGSLSVFALASDTNTAGFASSLTVTDIVTASADVSAFTNLSTIDGFNVHSEQTLTITAAQAASKSILGSGNVTVKDLAVDTDLSTITASGTLSATVTETLDLTEANLSGLDALTISDEAGTAITVTITPAQYAALVGKVILGANDTLVSTDTTIPTSTITSAAFDENTGTLTITGTNFDTILETTEDAATDVKARLDWSKLSWDINGDDGSTANVSFEVGDISSVKVTDATTLTITLTNTKTAALIATAGYGATGNADTLDVSTGFIRDMSHNAATTDAAATDAIAITADNTAPTIASVTVADGTYKIGDTVAVTVTAGSSETGLTLAGTFNGQTLSAITDNEDGTYTGTYTVVSGDTGIADEGSVTTSITLTDAASNISTATTSVTLSGESIDATAPTAPTAVTLTTVGGTLVENTLNGTNTNLTASATITAGEATGGSAVLKVDGTTIATDSTIAAEDTTVSFDLEKTTAEELQAAVAAGGTVTVEAIDAAGNATASTESNPTLTVDYTAPVVSSVAITSATGHHATNGTINGGSLITVTVTFDEAVTITGTPQLGLAVGGDTVQASYLSGTGTTEIVFKTTDYLFNKNDADGVAIAQNALSLNSGTIKDAAGNDATITHVAVADNSAYKLDGTVPTASNFTVTSTTVGATLNEIGELVVFDTSGSKIDNISSVVGLAAGTPGTVTVAAQSNITNASFQPMDAAGNGSVENVSMILGTTEIDAISEASFGQFIFGFAGADAFTLKAGNDGTALTQIADYAVNTTGESIAFGSTAAVWTTAVETWTIDNGVATKTGATVSDFYTAFVTATGAAGEVVAFVDGGNTYLFGEGAGTDDADNTAVVLVGVEATAVAITAAAGTVLIA